MFKIRDTGTIGLGVFTTKKLNRGVLVGEVCLKGVKPYINAGRLIHDDWCETHPLGRYINHSSNSNCDIVQLNDVIDLVTNQFVKIEEELTMNYFDIARMINIPEELWEEYFYTEGIFK